MLTLQVTRPKNYTVGRTQSYRVVLLVEGTVDYSTPESGAVDRYIVDKNVFVVLQDAGEVQHFTRVALPAEFSTLTTTPGDEGTEFRTNRVDLYLPSKQLADEMVPAVAQDIQDLLGLKYGRRFTIRLDGGDMIPPIEVLP